MLLADTEKWAVTHASQTTWPSRARRAGPIYVCTSRWGVPKNPKKGFRHIYREKASAA